MESEREQLLYGDHCRHGTAIGTPGGADFMCHYCEMGLNTWVKEVSYELMFSLDAMVNPIRITTWFDFDIEEKWQRLVDTMPNDIWCSPEALAENPVFEVRVASTGYWDE